MKYKPTKIRPNETTTYERTESTIYERINEHTTTGLRIKRSNVLQENEQITDELTNKLINDKYKNPRTNERAIYERTTKQRTKPYTNQPDPFKPSITPPPPDSLVPNILFVTLTRPNCSFCLAKITIKSKF